MTTATALYELAILAIAFLAYRILAIVSKRKLTATTAGQMVLPQVQGAFVILAVLGVIAGVAVFYLKSSDAVQVCKQQEGAIATALASYESAVGTGPAAMTSTAVKTFSGGTAGTFSNPNNAKVDYLSTPPIDPAAPTGSYLLTYTPNTATTPESYTIVCPGVHTQADLASLTGGASATEGHIQLSNGVYTAI
jgi:hypothetical protein